uniref:Secreted protein n=1 Tax=Ascaris lumbricoides TaxID=6252 RepID=A0A0M3HP03_ASCLU
MHRAYGWFACFMLVFLATYASDSVSSTVRPAVKTLQLFPCFICEEQQRYKHNDGDESLEELIERDEEEGFLAVEEMDDQLSIIKSSVWKKPQKDIHALKSDIEQLRDAVQNSTITLEDAEAELKALKSKYDAITLERETNERSALKSWIQLPIMRHRLLRFEARLLDDDIYGKNQSQITRIDKMRLTMNDVAMQLRAVYEYYFISDDDLLNAGVVLSEAESELLKRRALLPTEKPKQKCFWFFCI